MHPFPISMFSPFCFMYSAQISLRCFVYILHNPYFSLSGSFLLLTFSLPQHKFCEIKEAAIQKDFPANLPAFCPTQFSAKKSLLYDSF